MDYSDFFRGWRDEVLKSYTRVTESTVESAAFIQAMSASTDSMLASHKQARQAQLDMLQALDIPTRKALAGLARQTQMVEKRALETEERAEAVLATQDHLHQQLESLSQAVGAAKARVQGLETLFPRGEA